jgi:hypothetical protein
MHMLLYTYNMRYYGDHAGASVQVGHLRMMRVASDVMGASARQ